MKVDFSPDMLCYQFVLCMNNKYTYKINKNYKTYVFYKINQYDDVMKSREIASSKHLCIKCLKKLVPVGNERQHGKSHSDWSTRELHKRCYKELILLDHTTKY